MRIQRGRAEPAPDERPNPNFDDMGSFIGLRRDNTRGDRALMTDMIRAIRDMSRQLENIPWARTPEGDRYWANVHSVMNRSAAYLQSRLDLLNIQTPPHDASGLEQNVPGFFNETVPVDITGPVPADWPRVVINQTNRPAPRPTSRPRGNNV